MNDLSLIRQPIAWLEFLKIALASAAVFAPLGLDPDTQALIVAAVAAAVGAVQAAKVRPIAPAAFTAVVTTVAALAARYGFDLGPEKVAGITSLLSGVLALQTRAQVTPAAAPKPLVELGTT